MALVVAQEVPTSSAMALPHGPTGVAEARRRLRKELSSYGVPDSVVDDAVLILSELLSNSCRHARPIKHRVPGAAAGTAGVVADGYHGGMRAGWHIGPDGMLVIEATDGGGPTRPLPASPSLSARGGRGLGIVGALSTRWGVRDTPGEVTVWAALPSGVPRARHEGGRSRGPGTRELTADLGTRDIDRRRIDHRGLGRGDLSGRELSPRLDGPIDFADPFDDL